MAGPSSHSDTEALIPKYAVELDSRQNTRNVSVGGSFQDDGESSLLSASPEQNPFRSSRDVSARSSFYNERDAPIAPHPIELNLLRPSGAVSPRSSFHSDRSSVDLIAQQSIELQDLRKQRDTLPPPPPKELAPFSTAHAPLSSSMIIIPLVTLPFALVVISAYRKPDNNAAGACLLGSTEIVQRIDLWSISNIVAITLPVVSGLSFTGAKFLDLFWDLVVGRGGQMLLLIISYRAFSKVLTNLLPTNELTCDAYAAVAFDNGTLAGSWTVFRDFARGRYPRTRYVTLVYLVMLFSGIYIAIWPTLISSTTSYGSFSNATIATTDSGIQPLSSFTPCWGIVSDGSRVGLEDDYIIPANVPELYEAQKRQRRRNPTGQPANLSAAETLYQYYLNHTDTYREYQRTSYRVITDNISTIYPSDGGSSDSKSLQIKSTFTIHNTTQNLPSPLLNIYTLAATKDQKGHGCYYLNRTESRTVVTGYQILHTPAGSCLPSREYQWGFSFLLLFVTSLFTAFWFFSVLYLSTYERYRTDIPNHAYTPHLWRAVADLGHVLASEVGRDGHLRQTPELRRRMRKKRMRVAGDGGDG